MEQRHAKMFQHSDISQSRHDRMFELLRQKNQADTTVARVQGYDIRRISANEMLQLQRAAIRSLQAQENPAPERQTI